MRRRLAVVLGTVLAASGSGLGAAPPAAATDICGFTATMDTGTPLVAPVTSAPPTLPTAIRQPRTVGWKITSPMTTCVSADGTLGKTFAAAGTMTGWCGHSSGQGVTVNGHSFAWVQVGTAMLVTGHIVGVMTMTPDPFVPGNDCLTGATSFIVTGMVVLVHCSVLTSTLVTVPIPPSLTTLIPGLNVHTGPMSYHASICIPGAL